MQLLVSLFQISPDALSTGAGFTIPEVPKVVDAREMKGIRGALPTPKGGKVALVGAQSEKPKMVSFEKAVEVLKEAEGKGQLVWLILSNEGI